MALKIFVDFDGTITKNDVGNAFFREFGGEICDEYVAAYRAEKISAKELFRRETAAIGLLDERNARLFLRQQSIDESFKRFVESCGQRGLELYIVSDGLDYYIEAILLDNGIHDVSFFSNKFKLDQSDNGFARPIISFPFDDAECSRCACCKRNIMLTNSSDDDIVVYIGEGYSDRCPVQYADIVFAKEALQTCCQTNNISYYVYDSFDNIVTRLDQLLLRKRLKKRREAEMKRREAFACE